MEYTYTFCVIAPVLIDTHCDWEPLKYDVNVNSRVTTLIHTYTKPILNWFAAHFNVAWDCVFTVDWHNNLLFAFSLSPSSYIRLFVCLLSWVLRSTLLNGQMQKKQHHYNKKWNEKKRRRRQRPRWRWLWCAYLAQFILTWTNSI